MVKVLLASKSAIKISAVKNAFERLVRENMCTETEEPLFVDVIDMDVASGVAVQPVGMEMTVQGAVNRINATRGAALRYDYRVAIENGVVKLDAETYVDLAVVVIENCKWVRGMTTSLGIQVPAKIVHNTRRGQTIGDVIARRTKCNPKDPHMELTSGLVGRQELLEQAVYAAFGCMERNT